MTDQRLIVCQTESDRPDDRPAVVLNQLIQSISETEANDLYGRLIDLRIDHGYRIPIYRILSTLIWTDMASLHEHAPRSLELFVPLYRLLTDRVDEQTSVVECRGVSGRYLDFICDFAKNEGLELEVHDDQREETADWSLALEAVFWLVISMFDAILSLALRPLFPRSDANVLVKYPLFRSKTFQPIEQGLDIEYDATFTLLTTSYFKWIRSAFPDKAFVPFRCFGTVGGTVADYWMMARLGYDLAYVGKLESAVIDAIEAETGVRLPNTVGRMIRRAVLAKVKTLLYAGIAGRLFRDGHYRTLLLTSSGPTARALALSAERHGVDIYVLHHSITTPREPYDESYRRTRFSEGTIVDEALRDSGNEKMTPVATGMPKHLDIADRRRDELSSGGAKTILLGTQPFSDGYRQAFVHDVVSAVLQRTDWNVLVKIHPGEQTEFYRRTLRSFGVDTADNDRVRVVEGDLYLYVQESDLLVTVTSNVGIESVILGTPAIVYNPWSPNFRDPLYTTYGTVTKCEGITELIEVLVNTDLNVMFAEQQEMLDGLYMVTGNSIDYATERIERELMTSVGCLGSRLASK